jgi:hypothetical protein
VREASAKVGEVTIAVDVGRADVFVNGTLVGRSPLVGPVFVDPGPVVIEARLDGYESSRSLMDVVTGSSHTVDLKLTRRGSTQQGTASNALIWSGIFASGALMGVGVVSAAISVSKKAEAAEVPERFQLNEAQCKDRDHSACRLTRNAARDQYSAFAYASLWSLVGACAFGAGTATYALMGSSSVKGSAFVGPNGGMVGLSAVW